jgi:TPR repeat protein
MRRKLLRLRPYVIAAAVGTILTVDLSNQWEVPIAQLPNELHDRYVSELKADAKPAELLSLAETGNSQAQYIYALRHTAYAPAELQIKDDQKVAFSWMLKAAENRHTRAMAVVALYYARGLGVTRDEAKAAEWASKAADKGQPMGYRVLGDLAKAKADAIKPVKGAADAAKQQAAREELLGEAYTQYLRGANAGDRHSLRELAKAYEVGQPGLPQNYRLAVDYYTRAATRRDGKSIRILADRYESGEKTPKDLQQAYAWRLVLIEIEDNPEDVTKLGELEKKMKLEDVQAGQELAVKLIKDLPSEASDALSRLNPGR